VKAEPKRERKRGKGESERRVKKWGKRGGKLVSGRRELKERGKRESTKRAKEERKERGRRVKR
jgi:hypothetical protein